MHFLVIIFFVCIRIAVVYSGECPANCSCTKQTIDCARANLEEVPQLPGPPSIVVNLAENFIRALWDKTFYECDAVHAKEIYLQHNGLMYIQMNAFYGLRYLENLDLSSNELQTLDPGLFVHTGSLRQLKINHNHLLNLQESIPKIPMNNFPQIITLRELDLTGCLLNSIPTEWINMFPKLLTLSLDQNEFRNLSKDLFSVNKYIRHLDLRNNDFETLNIEEFKPLTKLKILDIRSNPIDCNDCSIKEFVKMFENRDVIQGYCYLPSEKKGFPVKDVKECVQKSTTFVTPPSTTTVVATTSEERIEYISSLLRISSQNVSEYEKLVEKRKLKMNDQNPSENDEPFNLTLLYTITGFATVIVFMFVIIIYLAARNKMLFRYYRTPEAQTEECNHDRGRRMSNHVSRPSKDIMVA